MRVGVGAEGQWENTSRKFRYGFGSTWSENPNLVSATLTPVLGLFVAAFRTLFRQATLVGPVYVQRHPWLPAQLHGIERVEEDRGCDEADHPAGAFLPAGDDRGPY
jgi:hypothetical protein